MKTGRQPQLFWKHTIPEPNSGCLLWLGPITKKGYGSYNREGAHRVAWELTYGKSDKQVLHRCDNRMCVNPDHLFEGSNGDNRRDCVSKGRQAKGTVIPSAKLDEEKVLQIRKRRARGETAVSLASEYGVGRRQIWLITSGRNWKHVRQENTTTAGEIFPRQRPLV